MKATVSKSYGDKKVFENLVLQIPEGEILCVLGESGVGKTTLLNIFAGLTAYTGEIEGLPSRVGYVFQEPRLLPNLSVAENLRFAGAKEEEIDETLRAVGLFEHKEKRPSALSGGEKQRVSLARAFLYHAPLLLLDEPFSSLDLSLKTRLWELLARLWEKEKPTTVLVTHDLEEAWALGHTIVVLKGGKIVYETRPFRTEFPAKYGEQSPQKQALLNVLIGE